MFNLNEKGFVKNKEMKIHVKKQIYGLNTINKEDSKGPIINHGPEFDVLIGEELKKIVQNIHCENNFNINYLKWPSGQ